MDEKDFAPENTIAELPEIRHGNEPRNKIKAGEEINLTEKDPALREIMVGVGWDLKAFESNPLDLDVSVFLLDKDDRTRMDEDFIFYNNLQDKDGHIEHKGDSRTGAGDGDDEIITIKLNELSYDILKIVFVLSIYDLDFQEHNFSMVKNVYFRIVNQNMEAEMFRFVLDEELTGDEGLMIGYLERIGAEWTFHAVGDTVKGGLARIADDYGIIVAENMA